jgi:hypothetical protein
MIGFKVISAGKDLSVVIPKMSKNRTEQRVSALSLQMASASVARLKASWHTKDDTPTSDMFIV